MSLFDGNFIRRPGSGRGSSTGIRGDAEAYAASLGLTPGGPGWGDAIRDFVLNGAANGGNPDPVLFAAAGEEGPVFRRGRIGAGIAGFTAQAPQERASPAPPVSSPISEQEPEGIPQFLGGRPGQPRRDTSLGGLVREDREEARGILSAQDRQTDRERVLATPESGTRAGQQARAARSTQTRLPIGRLSAQEETGGRGPGTVSTGVNDPGGISYGSYQLSSNRGQVQAFLRSNEGSRWSRQLQSAAPGTPEFQRRWEQIAAREPEAFHGAQHDFIGRTHYAPVVTAVRRNTGVDLDTMPEAVRDAAWSASVQHGTAATVLTAAVERADARVRQGNDAVDRSSPHYQEALINEMYDGRTALLTRLINNPRTSPGDRSTFRSIIANRYRRERAAALRQLRDERTGSAQPD